MPESAGTNSITTTQPFSTEYTNLEKAAQRNRSDFASATQKKQNELDAQKRATEQAAKGEKSARGELKDARAQIREDKNKISELNGELKDARTQASKDKKAISELNGECLRICLQKKGDCSDGKASDTYARSLFVRSLKFFGYIFKSSMVQIWEMQINDYRNTKHSKLSTTQSSNRCLESSSTDKQSKLPMKKHTSEPAPGLHSS